MAVLYIYIYIYTYGVRQKVTSKYGKFNCNDRTAKRDRTSNVASREGGREAAVLSLVFSPLGGDVRIPDTRYSLLLDTFVSRADHE